MSSSSFKNLKKSAAGSLAGLTKKVEEANSNRPAPDETLWTPTRDKAGNAHAIIRYLPAPDGEDQPWQRIYDHFFQGPGGYFIHNCRTTLDGAPCPACELNRKLWALDTDAAKKQVRAQKRRENYISNIQVLKDSGNSECEGQVFKYRFGKKIFEKLQKAMMPEFDDEVPLNPFDLWEGANFRMIVKTVLVDIGTSKRPLPNYDDSRFEAPGQLKSVNGQDLSDADLEKIWKQAYSLQELVADDMFKPYDELKKDLQRVMHLDSNFNPAGSEMQVVDAAVSTPGAVVPGTRVIPNAAEAQSDAEDLPWQDEPVQQEDDPDMAMFRRLAEDN